MHRRLVHASTRKGDVVWEPFGGLASASVAAVALGRRAFAAERDPHFADIARDRLADAAANRQVEAETEALEGVRVSGDWLPPDPPQREEPDPATKRGKLVGNVRDALAALVGDRPRGV